jgi:hypothetical protein
MVDVLSFLHLTQNRVELGSYDCDQPDPEEFDTDDAEDDDHWPSPPPVFFSRRRALSEEELRSRRRFLDEFMREQGAFAPSIMEDITPEEVVRLDYASWPSSI